MADGLHSVLPAHRHRLGRGADPVECPCGRERLLYDAGAVRLLKIRQKGARRLHGPLLWEEAYEIKSSVYPKNIISGMKCQAAFCKNREKRKPEVKPVLISSFRIPLACAKHDLAQAFFYRENDRMTYSKMPFRSISAINIAALDRVRWKSAVFHLQSLPQPSNMAVAPSRSIRFHVPSCRMILLTCS